MLPRSGADPPPRCSPHASTTDEVTVPSVAGDMGRVYQAGHKRVESEAGVGIDPPPSSRGDSA